MSSKRIRDKIPQEQEVPPPIKSESTPDQEALSQEQAAPPPIKLEPTADQEALSLEQAAPSPVKLEPTPDREAPPQEQAVPQQAEEEGILERASRVRREWSDRPFPPGVSGGTLGFMHACVVAADKGRGDPNHPANNEEEFRKMTQNVLNWFNSRRPQPEVTISVSVMHVPAAKRRRRK